MYVAHMIVGLGPCWEIGRPGRRLKPWAVFLLANL